MRNIDKLLCRKFREGDYWNPYHYYAIPTNAPKEPGKYKVIALFALSNIEIELDAQWNGCDWIVPKDGDEISDMVRAWKEIQ